MDMIFIFNLNTTIVEVKRLNNISFCSKICYLNTTIIKVKQFLLGSFHIEFLDLNTTIVKVKLNIMR